MAEQVEDLDLEGVYIDTEGGEAGVEQEGGADADGADDAFFEDVAGDALDYDAQAIDLEGETAQDVVEEVVEGYAEEAPAVAAAEDDDALFVEDTVGEQGAAAEEVATAEAAADDEDFCIDIVGDTPAGGAEEALAEDVTEEVAEDVVMDEAADQKADEPAAVEEVADDDDDDGFVLDTVGEAAEGAAAESPVADELPEPAAEPAAGQLFGEAVAESFSVDLDDGLDEEPPAKRQKGEDGSAVPSPSGDDVSGSPAPAVEEVPDSPLAEGLPDNLDELEARPAPVASPAFTPPSAKWSGVPKRPSGPPPAAAPALTPATAPAVAPASLNSRALPKVGLRSPALGFPPALNTKSLMPATSKAAVKASGIAPAGLTPTHVPPKAPPPATSSTPGSSDGTSEVVPVDMLSKECGYVFVVNNSTIREVAQRKLFGSPEREFQQMMQSLTMDTQLFLLNIDSLKLIGPFAPDSEPTMHLVKGAFSNRFPSQVKVLPTDGLIEAQLERKIPSGPKDASGMKLIQQFLDKGQPAPVTVLKLFGVLPDDGGSSMALVPVHVQPAGAPRPTQLQRGGGPRPPATSPPPMMYRSPSFNSGQMMVPKAAVIRSPMGARTLAEARTDKYVPGFDKEGRQYNLQTVIVNFANVGASYASKVLKKDNKRGDRLFDWEGVRKCVKCLTQELGLQVVGCIMENYWGPDNGSSQKPIPEDIRNMCNSIQETPSLTGKNHKSADDEMTIKLAWRRNCRFMDNDNYRDWLREMRDNRVRSWLENTQEMLQMRYFFDSDFGTFDTLDGNVPVGLLAEATKHKAGV